MQVGVVLPMGSHAGRPRPLPEVRTFAQHAEAVGLDALWVFDHVLLRFPGEPERGAHEAWTTMTLLGAATESIGIGSLVLGVRFRNPALLAKMAVTLDEAIGGRLTLGVGAGWHDPEYEAFGWPIDHRLGRTEEGFGILRGLLDGERVTVDGRWERARDAVLLPPPARRIPILTSSKLGRMARIAARYADQWNGAWVASPDDPVLVARADELRRACDEVGRDLAEIALTAGVSVHYDDADEASPNGGTADISGEPDEVAERLHAFAEAGYSAVMAWLGPMDERGLDRLAEAVRIMRG
jgi:alkanesulfonate monooxygenase SsuD/methylene tetrahydromethanopterin reductase-like flavin-dependent oxidoreductase (luciferase family)